MSHTFINPNWHVVLIHYPLGLLVLGILIELFAFFWKTSSARVAGRWMILLGALLMIPASVSGLYALNDVASRGMSEAQIEQGWRAVVAHGALTAEQWNFLKWHLRLELGASLGCLLAALVWLASSDEWRDTLRAPILIILLLGLGAMSLGAWYSGETVYRHGTAVQQVQPTVPHSPSEGTAAAHQEAQPGMLEYYLPPLQLHVVLAGFAVAAGLGALALAVRGISRFATIIPAPHIAASNAPDAVGGTLTPTTEAAYVAALRGVSPTETERVVLTTPRLPAASWWLVAALLALGTAGAGYLFLAIESHTWNPLELWKFVWDWDDPRRPLHVVVGVSIVVLMLILSGAARWGSQRRGLLGVFAILLVLAVACQIWLGVLMLFDGHDGSLLRFR